MNGSKPDTNSRELTLEELEPAAAAAQLVTNPGVIRGFNPQPDPPAINFNVMQSDVTPQ